MHHHGALTLALSFGFLSSFGQKRDSLTTTSSHGFDFNTSDGYKFYMDMGPLKNANKKYFKGEIGFWNQIATTRWEKTYMTEDQRFAGRRPDVLVYKSDVLESDLTIAGPMQADLFVSTKRYCLGLGRQTHRCFA